MVRRLTILVAAVAVLFFLFTVPRKGLSAFSIFRLPSSAEPEPEESADLLLTKPSPVGESDREFLWDEYTHNGHPNVWLTPATDAVLRPLADKELELGLNPDGRIVALGLSSRPIRGGGKPLQPLSLLEHGDSVSAVINALPTAHDVMTNETVLAKLRAEARTNAEEVLACILFPVSDEDYDPEEPMPSLPDEFKPRVSVLSEAAIADVRSGLYVSACTVILEKE